MLKKLQAIFILITVAVVTVVMAIGLSPIMITAPFSNLMNRGVKLWCWICLKLVRARVKARGIEFIDPSRTYILIANHQSLFDIPAVVFYSPILLRMVAKKELYWIPIFGWAMFFLRFIRIDRQNRAKAIESLKRAGRRIKKGITVVLFAEGTRTTTGELLPFKKGSFVLAIHAGVPIIPVTISGTINIHNKANWLSINTGKEVEVIFGEPIAVNGYTLERREELLGLVRDRIEENYNKIRHLSVGQDS